jgi:hypothetical protein
MKAAQFSQTADEGRLGVKSTLELTIEGSFGGYTSRFVAKTPLG